MGHSHSHEAHQQPSYHLMSEEAAADTPSASTPMDVDLTHTPPHASSSLPLQVPISSQNGRRRSRAPSSPHLSSPPTFGSASSRFPSFSRSSKDSAQPSSSSSASTSTADRPSKDKKRRRISDMLGISRSSISRPGGGAGGAGEAGRPDELSSSSQLTPLAQESLSSTTTTPQEEVDMGEELPSSQEAPPRSAQAQDRITLAMTSPSSSLSPDQLPLPPSRPSSTPPSTTTDASDPSDDPLWSPRLRAQSLISQITQELAEGGDAPVAAYVDHRSLAVPTIISAASDAAQAPPSVVASEIASPRGRVGTTEEAGAVGGTERPTLRDRLMSGLLRRGGSADSVGQSSTRSAASTASTSETPPSSAPPTPATPSHQVQDRVATGTSLIVQGLVQTSAPSLAPRSPSSTPNLASSSTTDLSGRATRPLPERRRSRSSAPSPASSGSASFDEQAILLGGLLGVATAATAASLLSPPPASTLSIAPPAARPTTSTFDSLRQRIARARSRPSAPNVNTAPGIEELLRSYMSSNLNGIGGANGETTSTTTTIPIESAAAPTELVEPPEAGSFEAFLADLQVDLVRALREFNGLPPVGEEGPAAPAGGEESSGVPSTGEEEIGDTATDGGPSEEAQARAAAVGGRGAGLGVEPRRLNWMRVYRFPPRNVQGTLAADPDASADSADDASTIPSDGASTSESTLSADPANIPSTPGALNATSTSATSPAQRRDTNVTPMIMVGVRSIARADVQAAFGGGAARPATPRPPPTTRRASTSSLPTPSSSNPTTSTPTSVDDTARGSSSSSFEHDGDAAMVEESTSDASSSSTTTGVPSTNFSRLRQAMRGIRARRGAEDEAASAQPSLAGAPGSRNFVLWVVGGLYSSDHPILAAPGLFGGTLDHDDLWALAELLGQAKPPTVSSADIAASGLEIIKGSQVMTFCEESKILSNSADRCMVCLGDYADDEDCRLLECKHVFHQECIDKWLNVGRNACPACRAKGVKSADSEPAAAEASSSAPVA